MYLASKINKAIESAKPTLMKKCTKKNMKIILNSVLNKFDVFVTTENDKKLSKGFRSIAAWYYPEANNIEIKIYTSKNDRYFPLYSEKDWKGFKFHLSTYIQHEKIHQHQWTYRDVEAFSNYYNYIARTVKESNKLYYSNKDEIDAWGHDIASEIKFYYPLEDPFKILKNINNIKKLKSYNCYKKAFKDCDWEITKKRLFKKTYQWLPYTSNYTEY